MRAKCCVLPSSIEVLPLLLLADELRTHHCNSAAAIANDEGAKSRDEALLVYLDVEEDA